MSLATTKSTFLYLMWSRVLVGLRGRLVQSAQPGRSGRLERRVRLGLAQLVRLGHPAQMVLTAQLEQQASKVQSGLRGQALPELQVPQGLPAQMVQTA